MTVSISIVCCYDECNYSECILFIVMLYVIMTIVVKQSVFRLIVTAPNVKMLVDPIGLK